jgi:hypothetical protein
MDKVATFLPNAIGRFKALLDNLSNVTQLQVDKARGIRSRPLPDGGSHRGLCGIITAHYGKNKAGGGQPIQPSLVPLYAFKFKELLCRPRCQTNQSA